MIPRSTQWYGWQPDLPDYRDHLFSDGLKVMHLPDEVDLRPKCPPVYDQGPLGSCTANAIAAAFDFERKRQGREFMTPSRLFIYWQERAIEGTVEEDAGAQIRDGIKAVVNEGVCPESVWQYNISDFAVKPWPNCYDSALLNQAIHYRRVTESLSSMLYALAMGLPFVFGFSVYDFFESEEMAQTGILNMPTTSETLLGGHAVLAVGYDRLKQQFLVRNSWGADWGISGHFWMPFDYLTEPSLADDRWVISQVET